MANEITLTLYVAIANGEFLDTFGTNGRRSFDQNNQGLQKSVLNVSTSEVTFDPGDIMIPGMMYMKNLTDDVTFDYGPVVSGNMLDFGSLGPAEEAFLRLHPSGEIAFAAQSGSGNILVAMLED